MKTIKQFKEIEKDILQIESLTKEIIEIEKLAMKISDGEASSFQFKLFYDEKEKGEKDDILGEHGSLKSGSGVSESIGVVLGFYNPDRKKEEDESKMDQNLQGYEILYVLGALLDIKNKQRTALIKRVEDSGIQM